MNMVNDRHTCHVMPHYADSSRLACQNLFFFFTFFIWFDTLTDIYDVCLDADWAAALNLHILTSSSA